MHPADRRQLATVAYLRHRRRARVAAIAGIALFVASVVLSHRGTADNWTRFNHRRFHVRGAGGGDSLVIDTGEDLTEKVRLLGIVAPAESEASRVMLGDLAGGREATLLLPAPQTRDDRGNLIASVFVDGANLSVELARAGVAYADRRAVNTMSGLIDPAESEARKKKRGLWEEAKFAEVPAWRQAWPRGFRKTAPVSN